MEKKRGEENKKSLSGYEMMLLNEKNKSGSFYEIMLITRSIVGIFHLIVHPPDFQQSKHLKKKGGKCAVVITKITENES